MVTPDWVASRSRLGKIALLQNPFDPDGPVLDRTMALFPYPPGWDEPPPPASRSVLFNGAPPQPGRLPPDLDSDPGDSDRSATDLAIPNLPLSKSGAPFFPAPLQQPSPSWLDVANFVAPNLVDYFTKTAPPQPPFSSTPGKIPTWDNPYAAPAVGDVVNTLAMVLSGGEGGVPLGAARLAAKTAALAERGAAAAEKLAAARRAQLIVNKAAGAAFEATTAGELTNVGREFGPQVTIQLPSKAKTRVDFITRDPSTGELGCIECKSSNTAPVKPNQSRAFQELEQAPATIVGKGKPGFPGGMKIPPMRVEIRRPKE